MSTPLQYYLIALVVVATKMLAAHTYLIDWRRGRQDIEQAVPDIKQDMEEVLPFHKNGQRARYHKHGLLQSAR